MSNDICLCGFREDQHARFELLEDMVGEECNRLTMEILQHGLSKMTNMFIEQSLIYGQTACSNYKRDNLIYLEQLSGK